MDSDAPRTVRSVENACDILTALRTEGPSTISNLASVVDLAPGSIHAHLSTLRQYGLVCKEGTKYQLGAEFVIFGDSVRKRMAVYRAARDEADELAHATGAFVHLVVEHDNGLLVIYQAFGDEAIGKEYYTRERVAPMKYIHCSSVGKAILAHLPEQRVDEIIDKHGLPKFTPRTITDRDVFKEELEGVRDRGVAFNDRERMNGIRAVSAPIIYDGVALGALGVSVSSSEWEGERFREELPTQVTRAANAAEVNLHAAKRKEATPG